jgi:nucleoside-diphosphate-sugar epimerase
LLWTEESLDSLLCEPSDALVADMGGIGGDVLVLGAGGKMGPTLAVLCKNAMERAGSGGAVRAVSRFSDAGAADFLERRGVQCLRADLLAPNALESLPDADNIIFMAGMKFGTSGNEARAWAMNAWLPVLVANRFKGKRIVVFSSGNVYARRPAAAGGASERVPPSPVGDYGASVLARERMFEFAAGAHGTKIAIYRLFYAVDLRYGVLCDIASDILAGRAISLRTPAFNCIWQKDASEIALRLLARVSDGPVPAMNATGPETASVREVAAALGGYLGKAPAFSDSEGPDALLGDAGLACETFGYPSVPLRTMIRWQAEWLLAGGRALGKPTHFSETGGKY